MMTIEKTAKELRRRIEAAGLQDISLTMACNGDSVFLLFRFLQRCFWT